MQDENPNANGGPGRNNLTFDNPEERREFWLAVIQEQVESGMSAYAFCKQQDLSPSSFHHWKQKLKKQSKTDDESEKAGASVEKPVAKNKTESVPHFAEVKISPPQTCFTKQWYRNQSLKFQIYPAAGL